jgi:aminopeptidase YwaD
LTKPEFKQKRTIIIIAFDAKESGNLGSENFIENLDPTIKANIKAMFNFDMVGMLGANKGLDLEGINGIKSAKEAALKAASTTGIEILNTANTINQRTDTKTFGEAGIPSVHVFTGLKSPYNRPEDVPNLLDYAGMVKIHDFTVSLLTELNQMPVIESSKSLKEKLANPEKITERFQFGLIASLGSGQHLYSDEFFDAKTAFSYSAGIQLNYKLNKNFNIQVEGLYDHNASRSAAGRYKRNSFTVPVNIEYGTSSYAGNDVRFFGFLGPYFRNNFGGTNGNDDLDYDATDETTEFGLSLGVGFDIQKFRIAYTYRQGFNSVYTDDRNVFATGSYLTLGFRF